jgi:hypothetical protein
MAMVDERQPHGEQRFCIACFRIWVYSPREQQFMQVKGYATPLRCPGCRQQRRREGRTGEGQWVSFRTQ